MESDYKIAKQAFHSDNLGESIWAIQATSLTALSAYVLYAVVSKRVKGNSPMRDYSITILPLLLGVTLLYSMPYSLNGLLLGMAGIVQSLFPVPSTKKEQSKKRSQGKWLDESDSDEEPSQPVEGYSSSVGLSRMSTSSSTDLTPSRPLSPLDPPTAPIPSPDGLSPDRLEKPMTKRTNRRRHSPTPSTHTHMAIDVLPTPETNTFSVESNPAYPPNPRSRSSGMVRLGHISSSERLPFLTVYRAHMMIMTIHCILAVDFPIFPRHQGKCEDFGTSLMDVGVGSFVFSLGLVSSRSAGVRSKHNLLASIFGSLKKASPVLLLGLVRVLMVKGAEYPEHVTEYGVHWNFFFTLGILPVLGILLSPLSKALGWTPLALLIGLVHHIALKRFGLQAWILSAERIGLIGMNKEGIVSLVGYLAIYGLGLGIGQHILRSSADEHRADHQRAVSDESEQVRMRMEKRRTECALELFGYSVGWWVLLIALRWSGEEVSRRMANLPYVLWTVAYNTTFLLGYLIIEICFFPVDNSSSEGPAVPPLLDAINRNGLAVFLLANLGTGLVNVSMRTMYASDSVALVVLLLYSGGISALAWAGKRLRLKI